MFAKPSDHSGSSNFFKPQELSLALGIIFETKSILENQARSYKGVQTGVGTDAIVDLTVFENQSQLDGTVPPNIMKGVRVDKDAIVNILKTPFDMGNPLLAGTVGKATSQKTGNQYWSILDLDAATLAKVEAYYEARTAAAAAAPSFD